MILPEKGNGGGGGRGSGEVEEATVTLVSTLCRRGFFQVWLLVGSVNKTKGYV